MHPIISKSDHIPFNTAATHLCWTWLNICLLLQFCSEHQSDGLAQWSEWGKRYLSILKACSETKCGSVYMTSLLWSIGAQMLVRQNPGYTQSTQIQHAPGWYFSKYKFMIVISANDSKIGQLVSYTMLVNHWRRTFATLKICFI